jgi:hypothetical protein
MKYLTVKQVAGRLSLAVSTVTRYCRLGKDGPLPNAYNTMPDSPRRGTWLIPEKDLAHFRPPKVGRPIEIE